MTPDILIEAKNLRLCVILREAKNLRLCVILREAKNLIKVLIGYLRDPFPMPFIGKESLYNSCHSQRSEESH